MWYEENSSTFQMSNSELIEIQKKIWRYFSGESPQETTYVWKKRDPAGALQVIPQASLGGHSGEILDDFTTSSLISPLREF